MTTPIEFEPILRGKNSYRLARIQMPDSPDLEEGFVNRLDIFLSYEKAGRRGRGYYLMMLTCSAGGFIEKHSIFADPFSSTLVETTKRFSRKKLEALVASVQATHLEQMQAFVAGAISFYENKGKAA